MKLDKLELSALLGMQARNRELLFMMEQIKLQIQQLNDESQELFSDIEIRLELEPDTIQNYDMDTQTGELLQKSEGSPEARFGELVNEAIKSEQLATNGFRRSGITELDDVD